MAGFADGWMVMFMIYIGWFIVITWICIYLAKKIKNYLFKKNYNPHIRFFVLPWLLFIAWIICTLWYYYDYLKYEGMTESNIRDILTCITYSFSFAVFILGWNACFFLFKRFVNRIIKKEYFEADKRIRTLVPVLILLFSLWINIFIHREALNSMLDRRLERLYAEDPSLIKTTDEWKYPHIYKYFAMEHQDAKWCDKIKDMDAFTQCLYNISGYQISWLYQERFQELRRKWEKMESRLFFMAKYKQDALLCDRIDEKYYPGEKLSCHKAVEEEIKKSPKNDSSQITEQRVFPDYQTGIPQQTIDGSEVSKVDSEKITQWYVIFSEIINKIIPNDTHENAIDCHLLETQYRDNDKIFWNKYFNESCLHFATLQKAYRQRDAGIDASEFCSMLSEKNPFHEPPYGHRNCIVYDSEKYFWESECAEYKNKSWKDFPELTYPCK